MPREWPPSLRTNPFGRQEDHYPRKTLPVSISNLCLLEVAERIVPAADGITLLLCLDRRLLCFLMENNFENMNTRVLSEPILLLLTHEFENYPFI